MFPPLRSTLVPFAGLCVVATGLAVGPPPGKTEADAEARSILAAHCVKCHGPVKQKGGLRFDSRDGLLGKGDSGSPAVAPGRPDASEMIRRVTATDAGVRMPPGDARLSTAQVAALRKWIEAGAAWSGEGPAAKRTALTVTEEDRQHWAFRALAK